MADSRPKGPQLRLIHLRVDELQPLSHTYSTRHWCLVKLKPSIRARIQIWIRETACLIWPTLYLVGRWAAQTSTVRVSARAQLSPPFYPHFNRPSGFWPCVKSCLVGGSDKYNSFILDIEHSPYYIALGSIYIHKMIYWQPTLLLYIYIYIYI